MKKTPKNKGMGIVVVLAAAIIIGMIVLTIAVVGMIKENPVKEQKEDTTMYTLAGVQNTTKQDDSTDSALDLGTAFGSGTVSGETVLHSENKDNSGQAVATTEKDVVEAGDVVVTTTEKSTKYDPIKDYENRTKTGENVLDDHHNNQFIKLVSEKYNVDPELLVAIYSVPDTGVNFVLEFSGKRGADGNVVKSPDTLTKVYCVDENKNISIATGKKKGNVGVSYAEGTLCFNLIKVLVMPQYPDYFTGVE